MENMNDILNLPPFGYDTLNKHRFLTSSLANLTQFHYRNCPEYGRMLDAWPFDPEKIDSYISIPFIPVRLFKEYELRSILPQEIVQELNSSGTTNQSVSRVFLDEETAGFQKRLLGRIVEAFAGKGRRPMIILDSRTVLNDRTLFSARGAGILGFSFLGTERLFALDEHMDLDVAKVEEFLEKHAGAEILLFGFTFIVWQHVCMALANKKIRLDMSNCMLFHGGGWKKMIDLAVDNNAFKNELHTWLGLTRIHNFYGMVEQTGTIHVECEHSHLHAPLFADVIVRRPLDFSIAEKGEEGMIEACSIAPRSFPGHVLLTDDLGIILGEDDCPCGRKGKYFTISGRIKYSDLRGCSDSYADRFR